jgi:hypothetical protein
MLACCLFNGFFNGRFFFDLLVVFSLDLLVARVGHRLIDLHGEFNFKTTPKP